MTRDCLYFAQGYGDCLVRRRLISSIMDALEALAGEELLCIVTRDDGGVLTPWTMFEGVELLSDQLNGWMDNSVWNAPKSL